MKLYACDFDGTLTTRDTLIEFIRFACGTPRFILGFLLHAPLLVLMKLGLYDNGKTKQRVFSWFFKGMAIEDFNRLCKDFADCSRHLLRPEMVRLLEQAQAEGSKVLIVSASIDNWVQPFFPSFTIVGTQIEVIDGLLTGRFLTPNCYGQIVLTITSLPTVTVVAIARCSLSPTKRTSSISSHSKANRKAAENVLKCVTPS